MKSALSICLAAAMLLLLTACASTESTLPASVPQSSSEGEPLLKTIIFPANSTEKTEQNAHIFKIDPFKLSVTLPDGWSIAERPKESKYFPVDGVWSVMELYNEKQEHVGAVGYNIYEEYEGAEDVPQAIYNQIALGNGYFFSAQPKDKDGSYLPVAEQEYGVTAVTNVYYSPQLSKEMGYGETEHFNKGILSYNRELLVYVAFEFDADSISDDGLQAIAKSINIKPAQ